MANAVGADFRGHFECLAAGKLAFPFCEDCGQWHWYPMPLCPHCRSSRLEWRPVGGTGEVWSWTVVRHAFDASRRGRLPYVVALVSFQDAPGVRLVANVEETSLDELRIGLPVELIPPVAGEPMQHAAFRPAKRTAA